MSACLPQILKKFKLNAWRLLYTFCIMKELKKHSESPRALTGGEQTPSRRLFSARARLWIFVLSGVCIASLLVIPLLLRTSTGANAVYVMAQSERSLSDTPEPYSFEIATPAPTAAPLTTPAPSAGVEVSEYLQLQLNDD